MQEAHDLIPQSDDDEGDMRVDYDGPLGSGNIVGKRQRVHVDVTLKKDIFLACVDDMLLAIQQETQDFKTFGKTANSDQDLNMTRYALDKS